MTHGNDAAFTALSDGSNGLKQHHGLTKREYFASMALQGILADKMNTLSICAQYPVDDPAEIVTLKAVGIAEALIKALNAGGEG
jgi:hypothetical protein